jgi:hypothetical protein
MRGLVVMTSMLLFVALTACENTTNSRQSFEEYSEDFYIQMFTDGEQSAAVTEMYERFIEEYDGFNSEALYANIDGMYKALGNEESATPYQMEVMRILNEN